MLSDVESSCSCRQTWVGKSTDFKFWPKGIFILIWMENVCPSLYDTLQECPSRHEHEHEHIHTHTHTHAYTADRTDGALVASWRKGRKGIPPHWFSSWTRQLKRSGYTGRNSFLCVSRLTENHPLPWNTPIRIIYTYLFVGNRSP